MSRLTIDKLLTLNIDVKWSQKKCEMKPKDTLLALDNSFIKHSHCSADKTLDCQADWEAVTKWLLLCLVKNVALKTIYNVPIDCFTLHFFWNHKPFFQFM